MTKKTSLFIFLAPIIALTIVSCTSTMIKQDDLSAIKRGMSNNEFEAFLKTRNANTQPKYTFPVTYESEAYGIEIYDMQTGTRTVMTSTYVYSKYGGYSMPVTTVVPVTAEYVFVFEKTGLLYWGFFNELQKEDDQLIQGLTPLIVDEYENQKRIAHEKLEKQMQQGKGGGRP